MDEKRIAFYRNFLHPLFSVGLPFIFILTFYYYLQTVFLNNFFPMVHPIFSVLLFITALGQAVSTNRLMKERISGIAPRIRELIAFSAGGFLVLMLFTGDIFQGDYSPVKGEILFPLVLLVFEWLLCYIVHRFFKQRELFLQLTKGKNGKDLVNAVRDFFKEAADANDAVKMVKRMIAVLQAIFLVLLFALFISFSEIQPIWIFLAVMYMIMSIGGIIVLNNFEQEHKLLGSGVLPDSRGRKKKTAAAILFLIGCFFITFPLTGDGSKISPELILDFLQRLNNIMNLRPIDKPVTGEIDFSVEEEELQPDFSQQAAAGKQEQSNAAAKIMRIIGIILLILLIAGFLFFLFKPLFSRDRKGRKRSKNLIMMIAARFKNSMHIVRNMWKTFFRWIVVKRKTVKESAESFVAKLKRMQEDFRESRKYRNDQRTLQKQISSNEFVKEYLRIIAWAKKNGHTFRKSYAPQQFLELIAEDFPNIEELIMSISRTFEKAVYSSHKISHDEFEGYKQAVRNLIKNRRKEPA